MYFILKIIGVYGMSSKINNNTDVLAALQLWQAFEYLSPQTPPKPVRLVNQCVWKIAPDSIEDTEMPWVDLEKRNDLAKLFRHPKRFLLYAGIIPGMALVENARKVLGAKPLDFSEQAAPKDAASVVLPIDEDGFVSGQPFVSTVPWAMAALEGNAAKRGHFNFSGFFGLNGAQEKTVKAMQELLVKRQLISPPLEGPEPAVKLSLEEKKKQFRTITAEDIQQLSNVAFRMLGWKPATQLPWVIQTQRISPKGGKRLEDPLNSFYAEEIESVQRHYLSCHYGAALSQFLKSEVHPDRVDLDENKKLLVNGVHPSMLPTAAWPGTYPLVTAQQFAVNTVHRELAPASGLFSVNGPPGTGKTTMLKDIVASIIQSRADILCGFENPDDAFIGKLDIENYAYPAWQLTDSLRGFGIVVTSANNGAVENISKELPGIGSIDENLTLDYFSEIADSIGLAQGKRRPEKATSWGLVSAALGNATNRRAFANAFWFADTKKNSRKPDETPDPLRPVSLQAWINQNLALTPSWSEARKQYQQARQHVQDLCDSASRLADMLSEYTSGNSRFQALLQQFPQHGALLDELEVQKEQIVQQFNIAQAKQQLAAKVYADIVMLAKLQQQNQDNQAGLTSHKALQPRQALPQLTQEVARAKALLDSDTAALSRHLQHQPGVLWLIFRRPAVQDWDVRKKMLENHVDTNRKHYLMAESLLRDATVWHERMNELSTQAQATAKQLEKVSRDISVNITLQQAKENLDRAEQLLGQTQANQQSVQQKHQSAFAQFHQFHAELKQLEQRLTEIKPVLTKAGLIDTNRPAWHLMNQPRDEFHKASPYQDDELLFAARRALFIASMNLHKAFLMNSWKKMKPTLAAFVSVLQGELSPHRVKGGVMALWDAFFLAVPLVSTTFASFPRLFKGVGSEELAWVLIDEAGQAAPQQAIGALWRAKRAVIVGDPIQLEPVVGIPEELVDPLVKYCGTPAMYVPPQASVQTLADRSNRFGTYLAASDADTKIWLGSPLVVHRRCLNPMFDISNAVAYDNKMVYGTFGKLGNEPVPSHWIDVPNSGAIGHWIPAQGEMAMKKIKALTGGSLRDGDNKLRIYVISPFKIVVENMRNLLKASFNDQDANEMCGTVHTFQGKEADYVLFLLGGDPDKAGVISSFAGRKPNLVNVAVTRAKKRLYVIGTRSYWCGPADVHRFYSQMAQKLGKESQIDVLSGYQ